MTNKTIIMIELKRIFLMNTKKMFCPRDQDIAIIRGTEIDSQLNKVMEDYPDNMPLEQFKYADMKTVLDQIMIPVLA